MTDIEAKQRSLLSNLNVAYSTGLQQSYIAMGIGFALFGLAWWKGSWILAVPAGIALLWGVQKFSAQDSVRAARDAANLSLISSPTSTAVIPNCASTGMIC